MRNQSGHHVRTVQAFFVKGLDKEKNLSTYHASKFGILKNDNTKTAVNGDAIDTLCSKNIEKIRLSEIDVRRVPKTCGTQIL